MRAELSSEVETPQTCLGNAPTETEDARKGESGELSLFTVFSDNRVTELNPPPRVLSKLHMLTDLQERLDDRGTR